MKIVFFGNEYHPLSTQCLRATIETGHEVVVGAHMPESRGLLTTARLAFRHGGAQAIARGAAKLLRARLGAGFRWVFGLPPGYASLTATAKRLGLTALDVTHLEEPETLDSLRRIAPDLILVAGFSKILRPEVLSIPNLGCVNVHPSLLPAYRGPNPVYWVVENNEVETGVTVHFIDEGIDTGDIIGQTRVAIESNDDETKVFERCVEAGAGLVQEVVSQFEEGEVNRTPQNPDEASYYSHPARGAASS